LGQYIVKSFLDTGQKRFARVLLEPPAGSPQPAGGPPDLTVLVNLVRKTFEPTDRTGSADNFFVRIDIELAATFQDATGAALAAAPLIYSNQVSMFVPLMSRQLCVTDRLDAALKNAADHLAEQMTKVIFRLKEKAPPSATSAVQPSSVIAASSSAAPAALSLRATLLDQNDNQILEGGEKIGVRIDVTNQGTNPISSVSAVLSGTPILMDAFSGRLLAQSQMGSLAPGETKSAAILGVMPQVKEPQRGEITVTVTAGSVAEAAAQTSVNQTLVAAVRPAVAASPSSKTPSRSPSGLSTPRR
jgi:hypothetical protein